MVRVRYIIETEGNITENWTRKLHTAQACKENQQKRKQHSYTQKRDSFQQSIRSRLCGITRLRAQEQRAQRNELQSQIYIYVHGPIQFCACADFFQQPGPARQRQLQTLLSFSIQELRRGCIKAIFITMFKNLCRCKKKNMLHILFRNQPHTFIACHFFSGRLRIT